MAGLKKVPVNSICPNNPNGTHGWTTAEGKDSKGNRANWTWCKYCSAIPK